MNKKNINWVGIALIALFATSAFICTRVRAQVAPVTVDVGNAGVTADGTDSTFEVTVEEAKAYFTQGRHARPASTDPNQPTFTLVQSAGPLPGSAEYSAFSADFIACVQANSFPTGTPSKTKFRRIVGVLDPHYLQDGWTIWSAVLIERPGKAFVPAKIVGQIISSPNGLFNKVEVFDNSNLIYAGTSIGYYVDGNDVTTITQNGVRWVEQPVTKFAFIGTASRIMNGSGQQVLDSNVAWVMSFPNFVMEFGWGIVLDGVTYSASAKLETKPEIVVPPVAPVLKVERISGGVKLSSTNLVGTARIQSSPTLKSPVWSDVGTLTGSQSSATLGLTGTSFFRLLIE